MSNSNTSVISLQQACWWKTHNKGEAGRDLKTIKKHISVVMARRPCWYYHQHVVQVKVLNSVNNQESPHLLSVRINQVHCTDTPKSRNDEMSSGFEVPRFRLNECDIQLSNICIHLLSRIYAWLPQRRKHSKKNLPDTCDRSACMSILTGVPHDHH